MARNYYSAIYAPHSHSIVIAGLSPLILYGKNIFILKTSVARTVKLALLLISKENLAARKKTSPSLTIDTAPPTFLNPPS
jgi:hypothetical protein